MPASVATDLRQSSLDATGTVIKNNGMKPVDCAKGIHRALETGQTEVYLPAWYHIPAILVTFTTWIDYFAAKKYGF